MKVSAFYLMFLKLRRRILSFFLNIDPEPGKIPLQSRVTLIAFYLITVLSPVAVMPTIFWNIQDGALFIVIMQIIYLILIFLGMFTLLISRNLSKTRIVYTSAIVLIITAVVIEGGGVRGLGLLFFVALFPLLYFIINFRIAVILPAYILCGLLISLKFHELHPLSLFNNPEYSSYYLLTLTVAVIIGTFAIIYQHYLVQRLTTIAFKDEVTGLHNRRTVEDMLRRLLRHTGSGIREFSVIATKIHDFARINSHHGTDRGDSILQTVADRLQETTQEVLMNARYSGTLFLTITRTSRSDKLDLEARNILSALAKPIRDNGGILTLNPNILVTRCPEDGNTPERILSNIMSSLNRLRSTASSVQYYDEAIHVAERRRFQLGEALKGAVDNNELNLVYQPKIRLSDNKCCGAEVLLRWYNRDYGEITPDIFIPLAEEIGLIHSITRWVASAAVKELHEINSFLPSGQEKNMVHAINLSPMDLADSDFMMFIEQITKSLLIPSNLIEFEITEGVLMDDDPAVQRSLEQLRSRGFRISIDDFGTGYSSLSYLHKMKVNNLKIDKSFISQLEGPGNTKAIVNAIISMAGSLELEVTAEGVETQQQSEYLRKQGCHYAQGWLFATPMTVTEYKEWLQK